MVGYVITREHLGNIQVYLHNQPAKLQKLFHIRTRANNIFINLLFLCFEICICHNLSVPLRTKSVNMPNFKTYFAVSVLSLCSLIAFAAIKVHAAISQEGTIIRVEWPLETVPTVYPVDAICSASMSGVMTLSRMQATDTKRDVVIDAATGATVLRFHNADENGNKVDWPKDNNETASRYVDFSVTTPSTMEVQITKIHMFIGAYSADNMKCSIKTGFGDTFSDVQTIYETTQTALPDMEMDRLELTPIITIPADETLHVRVLPWLDHSGGSNKYLLLRDMYIEGQAFDVGEGVSTIYRQEEGGRFILREGQLYILRGDKTYTITGTEIK